MDFETASKVNLAEHLKYKDTGTQANIFTPLLLTGYWLSQVCLPEEGKLSDYDLWQMMEKEVFVSQDDYREIIKNGYGPWYEKFKKEASIFKAKEVLGDRMCIMGDVPAEMLAFADYDTVYSYCEKLIREIGPTGFILASGCDVPPNAKPECVMAMGDAAEQVRPQ